VLPTMTSVNPVVAVLLIGERAADLIADALAGKPADESAGNPPNPAE
jgi:choline dehydrogenase-like flavoprotein